MIFQPILIFQLNNNKNFTLHLNRLQHKQHLKYMHCNKTPTVDSILENASNYPFRTQGIAEAVVMHKY